MKFTKPDWVAHKDTSAKDETSSKRLSIFSVHVHPDGSRIATGGLDSKVRIWSTKPILNEASERKGRIPKLLSTLAMHVGPVLTVRWAHSGRWLASGSDDATVVVWDLDPSAKGMVWGSNEVNVEGWKPLKRLPGHESDVTDVAWSPGDRYLASVGLDSLVLIWCGFTLERLRKLDQHQGFVKGVCWDPVGEFLATQSDDRSVKIWRTTDWQLEAEIRKPFEHSPGSTFFRRLSWSPDGAHITASNAVNAKGFVFIAAVIARTTWTSDISLVGHENTIEVAAYNPHVFLRNPSGEVATSNICSVVALGADDRSVSVWQTKSARPIIVAKEVFERQIMDLAWSWDGLTLYAVSSDGTLAAFSFEPEELEGIAPFDAQMQYLTKFKFNPPPLPEGYVHIPHPSSLYDIGGHQPKTPSNPKPAAVTQVAAPQPEKIHKLIAKRKPKDFRRRQSARGVFDTSSVPSASIAPIQPPAPPPMLPNGSVISQSDSFGFDELSSTSTPIPSAVHSRGGHQQHSFHADPFRSMSGAGELYDGGGVGGEMDVDGGAPIAALDGKGKRKADAVEFVVDDGPGAKSAKPRTLGGDKPREAVKPRQLAVELPARGSGVSGPSVALAPPDLVTFLSRSVHGTGSNEVVFEARNTNAGNASTYEVLVAQGKQTQWLDYVSSPIMLLATSTNFCAACMMDGSVNVYSHAGRKLMPTLSLGAACAYLEACEDCLMAITIFGELHAWNVKQQRAVYPPISVFPIIQEASIDITTAHVRANGCPVIQLSSGVAHSYDPTLFSWIKLSDKWWIEGSDVWQGRGRGNNTGARGHGVVAGVEQGITELVRGTGVLDNDAYNGAAAAGEKPRPAWWNAAMTLGHLESKLHASRVLDSPAEYKQALLVYAQRIASEGFRSKAEELVKELFGPVYWRPGKDETWSPTVLGMSKRDLLREVLNIFARSKTLTKLAIDWQDLLKKAQ